MKKQKFTYLITLAIILMAAFTSCRTEGNTPEDTPLNPADSFEKKHDTALLLVTFGSTYDLPKATYEKQREFFRKKYPNTDLYYSYTSRTIINRLEAQGETFIQPPLWFQSFLKKKYKNVYVQSLHVIPGEEYTLLRDAYVKKEYNKQLFDLKEDKQMKEYANCEYAVLGDPLLSDNESIEKAAKLLVDIHAEQLKAGEVVALMGHGNPEDNYQYANDKYDIIEKMMQEYAKEKYGNGMVYVGTVDYPGKLFDDYLLEAVENSGAKKKIINLHPLMTIAGDHASNDMSGDDTMEDGKPIPLEEQSWKLQLQAHGWTVKSIMKGLGDYDEINQIFLDHLQEAIEEAKNSEE